MTLLFLYKIFSYICAKDRNINIWIISLSHIFENRWMNNLKKSSTQ